LQITVAALFVQENFVLLFH